MKWNQVFGGVFIGLGFGLFLGGAIVDLTRKWNSTSAAGVSMLLVVAGVMASRSDRLKKQPENLVQISKRGSISASGSKKQ